MSGRPQTNHRWVPSAYVLLGMASEGANEAGGPFSAAGARSADRLRVWNEHEERKTSA